MSSGKKSNNFLMQGSILGIATIIVRIIGLLYRAPLNQIIGNEGVGYYSTAYNIYAMILLISSYSIPLAVSKEMSAKLSLKQYRNAHKIFIGALWYAIVVGGFASLLTYFGAPLLEKILSLGAVRCLQVLAPTIFLSAVLGVFRGYFQGHNTMIPTSISQILEQILNAVVSIWLAFILTKPLYDGRDGVNGAIRGAAGSAAGTGIGVLTALIFCLFIFVMYQPRAKRQIARDRTADEDSYQDVFRIIIATITPVIFSTFIYNISSTVDLFFYNGIGTAVGFGKAFINELWGIYNNQFQTLINVPIALASAISSAMIPSITRAITRDMRHEVNQKVDSAIKFTMLITIPMTLGMMSLAEPIMKLLFRANYTNTSVNLMAYGTIIVIFYSLSTVTNGILQGIGKLNKPVLHSAISLAINIVVLIPMLYMRLHVYGYLAATLIFSLAMCILNNIALKKELDYTIDFKGVFGIPLICAVIMAGITFALNKLLALILPNSICILLCVIVAVLVYFILMILLKGITEEELRSVPKGTLLIRFAHKFKILR